ncbi:hypothetical protein ACNF49_24300 [Actinomadura sp. ATCC 39365]
MLLRVGRVAVSVVALVLAAAAASPLDALGPRPGAGGCPISPAGRWEGGDRPGELVPADGAVSVTMCELPLPHWQGQTGVPVRRLTAGVGAMVSELNGLPTRDVLESELRRRESAKGRVLGDDLHLGEVCAPVGYGTSLSFVVHYGDVRRPAVVLVDRNCGTARYAGRTRFGNPGDAFLRLYRAQLEARPTPVSLPGCAAELSAADMYLTRPACRYRPDGDVLRLRARTRVPDDLESVRSLINVATAVNTVTDRGGTESVTNATDCGLGRFTRPAALDVVWVGDTTGAIAEVWVWRAPCRAVYAGSTGGRIPHRGTAVPPGRLAGAPMNLGGVVRRI